MSDLTLLLIWFSFLLTFLAVVLLARVGAVKTAVEGLVKALRNFPPPK
jgi:Flp pilus assembly pilin Flp